MDKSTYEWVWLINDVETNEGERVPMEKGDLLYISLCNDVATFHHRTRGCTENSGLWSGAKGTYVEKENTINGELPDGTTFSMMLTQEKGYHRLSCKHKRNPDQGGWSGGDGWEPD